MSELAIDFVWQRDSKGYRIATGRSTATTDFGYPPPTAAEEVTPVTLLVPRGGMLEKYRPLKKDTLYIEFCEVTDEDEALAFVSKYGGLTEAGLGRRGEDLRFVLFLAREMSLLLDGEDAFNAMTRLAKGGPTGLATIEVGLARASAKGRPHMVLNPPDLANAIMLQLVQAICGEISIKKCRLCGRLFEAGPGTDRRADAEFCADQHRITFNSRRRSKEK